jgi:23S rRNA (uracil1939-C5)-methyltransferase
MQDQYIITIDELDSKGFGLSHHEGVSTAVLGVLEDEEVEVKKFDRKKGVVRANIVHIHKANPARILPLEASYQSTSPFQIAQYEYENKWKHSWICKQFDEYGVTLPSFGVYSNNELYGYRNKIEFSVYQDDEGMHLAFHKRGTTKGKQKVTGTLLAPDYLNDKANIVLKILNENNFSNKQIKGLLMHASISEKTVTCSIYCIDQLITPSKVLFSDILDETLVGIEWIYSDKRAPDFRITSREWSVGVSLLNETILDTKLQYGTASFFQTNPVVFTQTISVMRSIIEDVPKAQRVKLIDLYAGVGTIGISLRNYFDNILAVEASNGSRIFANDNAKLNDVTNYTFIESTVENCEPQILSNTDMLVVDPPRSGLFPSVVKTILEYKPKRILYLSCNPATQARDFALLASKYKISSYHAFDYYPRTTHVEGLLYLEIK